MGRRAILDAIKAWLHRQWWGTPEPRDPVSDLDRYYDRLELGIREELDVEDAEAQVRLLRMLRDTGKAS